MLVMLAGMVTLSGLLQFKRLSLPENGGTLGEDHHVAGCLLRVIGDSDFAVRNGASEEAKLFGVEGAAARHRNTRYNSLWGVSRPDFGGQVFP